MSFNVCWECLIIFCTQNQIMKMRRTSNFFLSPLKPQSFLAWAVAIAVGCNLYHYFHRYFSIFSHSPSQPFLLKILIYWKLIGVPNNIEVDTFPNPANILGPTAGPFGLCRQCSVVLQVLRCTPFTTRLVFWKLVEKSFILTLAGLWEDVKKSARKNDPPCYQRISPNLAE